jgi:hypothetical protein
MDYKNNIYRNEDELNYRASNYLSVEVDLSEETWNTVADHQLLEVTGLVRMRIIAEVTTTGDDTSGNTATIQLGTASATDGFIAATEVDDLAEGELFYDATPTVKFDTTSSVVIDKIVSGEDIYTEIAGEAATAGVILFHVWWEPLKSGSSVIAGDGSASS